MIVIGGGISGLTAAHRLLAAGQRVTVLEASGRFGGKLRSGTVAGVRVDLGAESMLARRPEGADLARELGLGDALCPPAVASAAVWTQGALRPMPRGHVMGVPGTPAALAGVLSDTGLARIARDAELPPTELGDDTAIGRHVAARMGHEVVDRLVEPLLGGVYAGDAYRISMRAAVPQLFEAARAHPSLLAAVRSLLTDGQLSTVPRPAAATSPFLGIDGGLGRLATAATQAVRDGGGTLRTGVAATGLRRADHGWLVALADGRRLVADGLVLAVPASAAAQLLTTEAPAAAQELATIEYASMALVTMAFRRTDLTRLPRGSGFLVPAVDGRTIKAATYTSTKWDWAAGQDPGLFLLRTSIGRHGEDAALDWDDADLVRAALADLAEASGLAAKPVGSQVTRWHDGLPQYAVGHTARIARARDHLAALPGVWLCGASYDGVGIPACIASARQAVHELLLTLPTGPREAAGRGWRHGGEHDGGQWAV